MNELLETAYNHIKQGDFEKSLVIYKSILDSTIQEHDLSGTKYRAIKECFFLAKKYPPAMQFLSIYKDKILNEIKKSSIINPLFLIEYAEICYLTLNDNEFLEFFENICKTDKKIAIDVYSVVEKILINNKRWDLCNICIDDTIKYCSKLIEQYDELARISKEHHNGEYDEGYKLNFCKKLETLFWILKVSERAESKKTLTFVRSELKKRSINCEKRE